MIRIFSLYNDSFCHLLCVTFCLMRRCFESGHLVQNMAIPSTGKTWTCCRESRGGHKNDQEAGAGASLP